MGAPPERRVQREVAVLADHQDRDVIGMSCMSCDPRRNGAQPRRSAGLWPCCRARCPSKAVDGSLARIEASGQVSASPLTPTQRGRGGEGRGRVSDDRQARIPTHTAARG